MIVHFAFQNFSVSALHLQFAELNLLIHIGCEVMVPQSNQESAKSVISVRLGFITVRALNAIGNMR